MSIDKIYGMNAIMPEVAVQTTNPNTLTCNTTGRYQISDASAPHNIVFHGKGGKEVGRFDFSEGDLKFEGDASEAAKVFVEWARNRWNDLRATDKVEVLQQVIDDMLHEASGELYSEEEKVAILTCMQIAQKRKKEYEAPQYPEGREIRAQVPERAVTYDMLKALASEGKSL